MSAAEKLREKMERRLKKWKDERERIRKAR